jgi:hypothetical protein
MKSWRIDNMQEITDYDRWKFRRCIETLERYGCGTTFEVNEYNPCPKCKFNLTVDEWNYLHRKMIINNVSK